MNEDRPSTTAWRVALARAAHQVVDDAPRVFEDPLATAIVAGERGAGGVRPGKRWRGTFARRMRAFVVARSRVAEDELAAAMARGVRQYVVLGAGLDTFALRNRHLGTELHVFEVDHPATQAWKKRLIARARIPVPASVSFVPVDFDRHSWTDALRRAGWRADLPTHVAWLGVSMYLAPPQVEETLAAIAAMPAGSSIVFDYLVPPSRLSPGVRLVLRVLSLLVSLVGEPLRSQFTAEAMRQLLVARGFRHIEDAAPADLNARFFRGRRDGLALGDMGRIVCARL